MKTCIFCQTKFANVDPTVQVCSGPCAIVEDFGKQAEHLYLETYPSEDMRTFFYPLSFGELVDSYTILSLRRAHTKSIRRQQETDYRIFKIKKSIQTHLEKLAYNADFRKALSTVTLDLLKVNTMIWQLRNELRGDWITDEQRLERLDCMIHNEDLRETAKRQLDVLLTTKSMSFKIFNGDEGGK